MWKTHEFQPDQPLASLAALRWELAAIPSGVMVYRQRRLHSLMGEWKLEVARSFAALNGWRRSQSYFNVGTLRRAGVSSADRVSWFWDSSAYSAVDHTEYFRQAERPYRAAAAVVHLYGGEDAIARAHEMAADYGLVAQTPPFPRASWYWPGATVVVAYTRPGVQVRWLREQEEGWRMPDGQLVSGAVDYSAAAEAS